jgi:hypothetical protein
MTSAVSKAQPWVAALVELDELRSGSRMNAYENVARAIGVTASWVRKFLGNQPVRLDADVYLGIEARYRAACARWDAEAELQKQRFFALGGGDVNAPDPSLVEGRVVAMRDRAAPDVAPVEGEGAR